MIPRTLPDSFFEALGRPPAHRSFDAVDDYRFSVTVRQLAPGSVLDVGAFYGDFLKLARKEGREIFGTEVNQERVDLVNGILGDEIVRLGFRNGCLEEFASQSIENVVCTEVIEHVPSPEAAIRELCRVARRRVIVTVPFREKLDSVLCVHCANHTPLWGHFHRFDLGSFVNLTPSGWRISREFPMAGKLVSAVIHRLPLRRTPAMVWLIRLLESVVPGPRRWLLVVLDKVA